MDAIDGFAGNLPQSFANLAFANCALYSPLVHLLVVVSTATALGSGKVPQTV